MRFQRAKICQCDTPYDVGVRVWVQEVNQYRKNVTNVFWDIKWSSGNGTGH